MQVSRLTIWYWIISLCVVPWKRLFSTTKHSLFASSSLSCLLGSSTRDGLLILSPLESCWLSQRYDATTVPLGLTRPDGHCCGSYASWLGRTVVCFLPLESCMVPCELILRGEAFGSIPIQSLLTSASGVHSIFGSRDLLCPLELLTISWNNQLINLVPGKKVCLLISG